MSNFLLAIDSLNMMLEQINPEENNFNIDDMLPALMEQEEIVQYQIDKRISYLETLEMLENQAKADAAHFQNKLKKIKMLREKVEEKTLETLLSYPNIKFQGTHKKLAANNAGGKQAVNWKVELQTIKDVVDPADISKFGEEFVDKITVYQLNKKLFEASLQVNKESEAADLLPRKKYLKIS